MVEKMNISNEEADNYYNIASSIIAKNVKEKIKELIFNAF